MNVIFNFPDGKIVFQIRMDCVPRVGDVIYLGRIVEQDFPSKEEYKIYKDEEYEFRQWTVDEVSWSPMGGNLSYVNIMLEEYKSK